MAVSPQTTLDTVADYISDARVLLLDQVAPYRYDDSSLLTALNVTLLEARRLRADLFVFQDRRGGRVAHYSDVDNTQVNIEEQFRLGILHGVIAHAIQRDQEDVQDARATAYLNIMSNILTGKSMMPVAPPGAA